MVDFEKELLHGIPLDLASDFFIRIRGQIKEASLEEELEEAWNNATPEEQREIFKMACESGYLNDNPEALLGARMRAFAPLEKEATGAGGLPPTAMGQNMAPVQTPPLPPTGQGQNTIKAAAGKDPDAVGKERGRAQAAAEFERRSHRKSEHNREFIGRLGGAGLGGAVAHRLTKNPVSTIAGAALGAHLGGRAGKQSGRAADEKRWEKNKKAFDTQSVPPEVEVGGNPELHQYLAGEREGQQAEEQNMALYYQRKFQEASQQLQQTQEQMQQTQSLTDSLQTQVAGSQQQIQAAMQQAELAQQAAMQNVQQAHDMAMSATTQAMEAQGEVLRQKQLAAAMRMGVMQVKDQVMNALAQDPTEQLASQLSSPPPGSGAQMGGPGQMDPAAGGMQNASTQAAMNPDGTPAQQAGPGTPAQEAGAGTAPNSAGAGETGEAVSDGKSEKSESSGSQSTSKGSTKVEIKQAFSIPHALGGAALMGAAGAGYSQMSNEPLRQKVDQLSGVQGRSFGQSMDLAQSKARLAMGELASEHPVATTAIHALAGGVTGGTQGPQVTGHLKNIGQNIKNLVQG